MIFNGKNFFLILFFLFKVHYVAGLMHRVPPLVLNKPEDYISTEESSEHNYKKSSDVKYTKEPDKRLYHFVDDDD